MAGPAEWAGPRSCFVADRATADPVERFGSPRPAYERLATQPLPGTVQTSVPAIAS
jgi:hypothetical protein